MAGPKLTPEQWAVVRRRWEGCERAGFDWLPDEIMAAFAGVEVTRQGVSVRAKREAWAKGGKPSSPLAVVPGVARSGKGVAQQKRVAQQNPQREEGADPGQFPGSSARTRAAVTVHSMDHGDGATRAVMLEVAQARKAGRPTKYIPEVCYAAKRYCLLGATNDDLADLFNVNDATIDAWKVQHPEFMEAIQAGKAGADSRVAQALFTRAVGYTATVERPMSVPVGDGQSVVEIVQFHEYVAPDQQAARYWLNNRQPGRWREKVTIEPEMPDTVPSAEVLNDIYERKMRTAAEKQLEVAGRAERLGIVGAMQSLLSPPSDAEPFAPDDEIQVFD
jgi:hypothetical protein